MNDKNRLSLSISILTFLIIGGCDSPLGENRNRTFAANIAPLAAAPYQCGPRGPSTESVMLDLNFFWQSRAIACSCLNDSLASGCANNAVVYGNGFGYIFYDPNLLNSADASGSRLPADMIMAHEFGHNVQLALQFPHTFAISRELQADCLAGFYIGSRIQRQTVTEVDVTRAFQLACTNGDSSDTPWWAPSAHGSCQQRVNAVQTGIGGFLAGVLPGQACPSS